MQGSWMYGSRPLPEWSRWALTLDRFVTLCNLYLLTKIKDTVINIDLLPHKSYDIIVLYLLTTSIFFCVVFGHTKLAKKYKTKMNQLHSNNYRLNKN